MTSSKLWLLVLMGTLLVALAACAPTGGVEPPAAGGPESAACPPGKESDTGTDCVTPVAPLVDSANPDAPVSSDGSLSLPAAPDPGAAGGGEPGFAGSGEPLYPDPGAEPPVADRSEWLTYTDPVYGFTVAYPPDRVPAPLDAAALAQLTPRPLAAVYFHDPVAVAGGMVEFAPPELAVRVYANEASIPLDEWLAGAGLMASGSAPQPYGGQDGGPAGLRACLAIEIAPNCFDYLAGDGVVYELTPLGPVGEEMAATFRITAQE